MIRSLCICVEDVNDTGSTVVNRTWISPRRQGITQEKIWKPYGQFWIPIFVDTHAVLLSFVVHIPFIPLSLNRDSVLLEEKFHNSLLERARLEGELETTRQSDQLERDALKSQNASLRDEIKTQKTQLQAEVTREHDKVINVVILKMEILQSH